LSAALWRVFREDDGAAIVEYGLITAGISIVAVVALQLMGVSLNSLYASEAANWSAAAQSGQ
jgi:Flp pilus assembly pilin Flp